MSTTAESQVLAKMKRRSQGAYDRVKETEAKAGGRELPGGLKDAKATITDAKLDEDKNGEPYFFVYSTVVDPEEYRGIFVGLNYKLHETKHANFQQTYDEALTQLVNDLKLLGLDSLVAECEDEFDLLPKVVALMKDKDETPITFRFNTSRRARKDGGYNVFIQGLPPEDYEVPSLSRENEQESNGYAKAPEETKSTPQTSRSTGKTKTAPREAEVNVGDVVVSCNDHFGDGNDYQGTVKEVDVENQTASVKWDDDGSTTEVPLSDITISVSGTNVDEGGDDDIPFEVGDTVVTTDDYYQDGNDYEGEVTEITNGEATVNFPDGPDVVPVTNLRLP